MSLNPCRECGETVSDQAKICPKCGIAKPIKYKRMGFGAMCAIAIIGIAFVSFINGPEKDAPSNAQSDGIIVPEPLKSEITSCKPDSLQVSGGDLLSTKEQVDVCDSILASLGKLPSTSDTKEIFKAVWAFKYKGYDFPAKEIAYQLMNIVEVRGITDPAKINTNMNTVFKIYGGSQGHVTPRDINIFLRAAGPMARTLSDDGLLNMAAIILEEKKAQGE